ncbi:MAG: hypothetical protein LUE31_10800, partial [Lachnospiraceae bacterium]|nr:hypothetical protein [Lachnospiraceae bacterium]
DADVVGFKLICDINTLQKNKPPPPPRIAPGGGTFFVTVQNSIEMERQTVQVYLLKAVFTFQDGRNTHQASDI